MHEPGDQALTDEQLAPLVAGKDISAFVALYDRDGDVVYGLSRRLLGARDAEDAVQEVFARLWQKAPQFEADRGSFVAWFMTIARNHVVHELRHRGRHPQFVVSEAMDLLLGRQPDPGPPPEELA